ncbi:MAG TPA: hypothetical protein VGY56_17000 [Verrucomicrobiae bacterium]|nr:hypothetical protein [Verrucomicrobiae bacterium]
MKTPREILLARHKAIEPKLDDVREHVVGKLNDKDTKTQSSSERLLSLFLSCPKVVWNELVLPSRRIWAGLAVVWLVLLAANFSMRDRSEIKMAKSPPSPEMIMAFRQQQQLLSELIGQDNAPVARPQKPFSPKPASERRLELLMT